MDIYIAAILSGSYFLKLLFTETYYPEVRLDVWAHRVIFFPAFAFLVISTIYKMVADKMKYDKKQKEIFAEQLSIKLKFLRSQISPHFIFNGYVFGNFSKKPALATITKVVSILAIVLFISANVLSSRFGHWQHNGRNNCSYNQKDTTAIYK